MFIKSHDENCKQSELEMKKAAESEKVKMGASKESARVLRTPIRSSNVKWWSSFKCEVFLVLATKIRAEIVFFFFRFLFLFSLHQEKTVIIDFGNRM